MKMIQKICNIERLL